MKTVLCPKTVKAVRGDNIHGIEAGGARDLSFLEIIVLILNTVPAGEISYGDAAVGIKVWEKLEAAKDEDFDKDGNQFIVFEDAEFALVKTKLKDHANKLFGWNNKVVIDLFKPFEKPKDDDQTNKSAVKKKTTSKEQAPASA